MSLYREQIVKRFRRSRGWGKVRKRFVKAHPFCACCGRENKLEVHHIKDFSTSPELELSPSNLIVLCRVDHHTFGHLKSWKSVNPEIAVDARVFRLKIEGRR